MASQKVGRRKYLSEEKKTTPEHKYSVVFVTKVGTKKTLVLFGTIQNKLLSEYLHTNLVGDEQPLFFYQIHTFN